MIKLKGDQGSFTIEASLLLPIVMCITMLLLFFSLYSYQKSMLLQVASGATERAAYIWDNSYKQKSGYYASGEHDSLYWRIGEDALLASLFGGEAGEGGVMIDLPGAASEKDSLPVQKLSQSSVMIPGNMPGNMNYAYSLTGRRVSAELNRLLHLPVLDEVLSDQASPTVTAQSMIVEPVEFIRTVDLMRYFGAKFSRGTEGSGNTVYMEKKDASEMMTKLNKR